MIKLILGLSFLLATSGIAGIATASEVGAEITKTTVHIKGVKRGLIATVHQKTNSYSPPLARCLTPCKETVETKNPIYIIVTPPKRKYGAIRRDMKNAVVDGENLIFDIELDTPENEELIYVRGSIEKRLEQDKIKACEVFSKTDLTSKARKCYKLSPTLPPRMERSGWCKVLFTILPDGRVTDVVAQECSEDMFRITSQETVKTYRYYPKLKDEQVIKSRLRTTLRYELRDGKGKVIPAKGEK